MIHIDLLFTPMRAHIHAFPNGWHIFRVLWWTWAYNIFTMLYEKQNTLQSTLAVNEEAINMCKCADKLICIMIMFEKQKKIRILSIARVLQQDHHTDIKRDLDVSEQWI